MSSSFVNAVAPSCSSPMPPFSTASTVPFDAMTDAAGGKDTQEGVLLIERAQGLKSSGIGDNADEKASTQAAAEVNEVLSEEDRISVNSIPEPELKHVQVDPPPDILDGTESPWATIAKSIREFDELNIKGYKEDIDNILVFAGLYAAVLSALIVESLQDLQPDPNDIMIALLSQVVAQTHTYSLNGGYLNSTAAPFDPTSIQSQNFKPSLAAKRVNVLWFASLILSLICACFGILVKQWLREYLVSGYPSAKAELRARHFRTPSLERWRVFTIAGLLPLVLQLALALFFVGLCFFTFDIHHSIGYTTVPLVAAWALLFIASAVAPALSPRCPYKTSALKDLNALVRTTLFHIVRLFKGMPILPPKSEWVITPYWTWWSLGYNEDAAVKDSRNDVDILVAVAATQTDDRLVIKMCSALKEMHSTPETMIDFVIRLSAVHTGTKFETGPLSPILDLSLLSMQTCTILMDIVAEVLAREVRKFPVSEPIEWTDLTRDCVSLLSARLPCFLSDKAMAVLSLCFAGTQTPHSGTFELMFTSVVHSKERHALCLRLQERVRNAFLHLNAWQFLDTLYIMMKTSCCTCSECPTIEDVLMKHADTIPSALRQHTCDVMAGYMLNQVKTGATWTEWHREIAFILYRQWAFDWMAPWHDTLKALVRTLLVRPKFAPYFYIHLFGERDFEIGARDIFCAIFPSLTDERLILVNMSNAFTTYLLEKSKAPAPLRDYFYLNILCFVSGQLSLMMYIVNSYNRSLIDDQFLPVYRMMWKMMVSVLCHFDPAMMTEKQTTWAKICLEKIDTLDETWLPLSQIGADPDEDFGEWCKAFPAAKSFFDDDVLEGLMKFLPSLEDVQSKRVRRILWKWEQSRISQLEEEQFQGQVGVDKVNGASASKDSRNSVTQDKVEHAGGLADDESSQITFPCADMHAVAVADTDESAFDLFAPNNSATAALVNPGHEIVREVTDIGHLTRVGP